MSPCYAAVILFTNNRIGWIDPSETCGSSELKTKFMVVDDLECIDGGSFVASYKSFCRNLLRRTGENHEISVVT